MQEISFIISYLSLITAPNSDFIFFLAFDVGGSRYLKKYQNTFDFISNNMRIMENTFSILKKERKKLKNGKSKP